jgi:hypothetical protein
MKKRMRLSAKMSSSMPPTKRDIRNQYLPADGSPSTYFRE